MPTDRDIERFIGDSFSSVWDLELLSQLLDHPDQPTTASELVERLRASELIVARGIETLVAGGMASVEEDGGVIFRPINENLAECARRAREFYARFPDRTRRLIVARHSPGLDAFAHAFRLRRD